MSSPPPPPRRRRSLRLAIKHNSDDNTSNPTSTKRRRGKGPVVEDDRSHLEVVDVDVDVDDGLGLSLGLGLGNESSVRVSDCGAVVEESSKKVKMMTEGSGKDVESSGKVNDKGKGKAILIEIDDDDDDGDGDGGENGGKIKMEDELESSRRRFTREEKGKGVVSEGENDSDFDDVEMVPAVQFDLNNAVDGIAEEDVMIEANNKRLLEQFKEIAKRNASKFAYFNAQEEEQNRVESEEDDDELPLEQPVGNIEDWPGPFSTAMKIIRDRVKNSNARVRDLSSSQQSFSVVNWTPRKEKDPERAKRVVPSLQSMCLDILANNVDAITSLEYVPDALRNRLSRLLCDSRRMNLHFLGLLLQGSPSEIRLADCSWLEECEFEKSFEGCDLKNLTVLQLDLSGHCVSDASLRKALIPKDFQALTAISLKGACRMSDVGLAALVSSAPALRSINLSQCSLLTDVGIGSVANSLGSILKELYLDDCVTLKAMCILPKLKQLKALERLSLRGIESVSDKFIRQLISTNGHNMKELVLASCVNLTDSSLKVIAETCSQLRVLDLSYLGKLTDIGMAHITNGCRRIQDLKLCRSPFSDDAIAAFLEASGESLTELSLNNIPEVGQNTTISLARRCKNLESLDLSWCRRLTDEALGLIADSCLSLRLLKLFGCSQVSSVFVDGHSNPHLHIVGLKLTPILEHIKRPEFQQGHSY